MSNEIRFNEVKSFIKNEGYTLLSKTYKNNKTKLKIGCPKGHVYEVRFDNFKGNSSRCPICSKRKKYTYNEVKKYIELKGYKLISKKYINALEKLMVKCPKGHEYKTTFNIFNSGHRCKKCQDIQNGINSRLKYNKVKEFIEKEEYTLLSKKYKNNSTKLMVKCPKGHVYSVIYNAFQNGNRCPICNDNKTSKGEKEVCSFVKKENINIIENDRTQIINPLTGRNLELDVWIPSLRKAIEYNGEYWHSFPNRQINDQIKKSQCEKLGIDLLIISDKEWNKNIKIKQIIRDFLYE